MPRVTHVMKARKANPHFGIEVGDSYYWWKFRYGGKRVSKTYPKQSQLTQSEYLGRLYAFNEEYESRVQWNESTVTTKEDVEWWESEVDELKQEFYDLAEELQTDTQDKLDNMPEQLQYAPTGELLQERIDQMDEMMSNLDGISNDIDTSDFPDGEDLDTADYEFEDDYREAIEDMQKEWIEERCTQIENVLEEISCAINDY